MIKYFALSLVLVGCVVDAGPVDDYGEPVQAEEQPQNPEVPIYDGAPQDLGCPSSAIEMPDGSFAIIPGLCDPFYIYKGYPDPTNEMDTPYIEEQQYNKGY